VDLPATTCWAEWKPGFACPNRAAWLVQHLDNAGHTRLCGLHRDAFAAAALGARVAYHPLYTPDDGLRRRYAIHTCVHCGCLPEVHHTDGRCYTVEEMGHRLRFWQQTGRWPAPDEGCEAPL
jgi:hypothetical protein